MDSPVINADNKRVHFEAAALPLTKSIYNTALRLTRRHEQPETVSQPPRLQLLEAARHLFIGLDAPTQIFPAPNEAESNPADAIVSLGAELRALNPAGGRLEPRQIEPEIRGEALAVDRRLDLDDLIDLPGSPNEVPAAATKAARTDARRDDPSEGRREALAFDFSDLGAIEIHGGRSSEV